MCDLLCSSWCRLGHDDRRKISVDGKYAQAMSEKEVETLIEKDKQFSTVNENVTELDACH